jgi:hypothetical protein
MALFRNAPDSSVWKLSAATVKKTVAAAFYQPVPAEPPILNPFAEPT